MIGKRWRKDRRGDWERRGEENRTEEGRREEEQKSII